MSVVISDIPVPVTEPDEALKDRVAARCGLRPGDVRRVRLLRRALDARKKSDIHFLCKVLAELEPEAEKRLLKKGDARVQRYAPPAEEALPMGKNPCPSRIVIVGLGPAGLFCGLTLAQYGYKPLLLERGRPVEERFSQVETFFSGGGLDTESNVMFGEGGAGTFSDGKLTSRSKDPRGSLVLETLHRFGGPTDILTDAKPHIGTDLLRLTVSNLRREIERLGGEVRFSARLTDIRTADGRISSIEVEQNGVRESIPCGVLVLAIGQGARDTYRMLGSGDLALGKKPFAVGVRIEHPQTLIDSAQFGALAGHPRLGPAEYRLTGRSGERGVYTFCMCPGGQVIASSSAEGEVVVNGMSNHARDGVNANAAVVVQVTDGDTPDEPLAGLRFIEEMERAAFRLGGGTYFAPAARAEDYLAGRGTSAFGGVTPTYRPGVTPCDLAKALPDFVAKGVADGIRAFGGQLKGFDLPDAVLTGVETRTSAPLRILRDGETMESVSVGGVYPVGEGAGYAGGIVSAAIDGRRAAEKVISLYRRD